VYLVPHSDTINQEFVSTISPKLETGRGGDSYKLFRTPLSIATRHIGDFGFVSGIQ